MRHLLGLRHRHFLIFLSAPAAAATAAEEQDDAEYVEAYGADKYELNPGRHLPVIPLRAFLTLHSVDLDFEALLIHAPGELVATRDTETFLLHTCILVRYDTQAVQL